MLGFCMGGVKPLTRSCGLTVLTAGDVIGMSSMLFCRFSAIKICYIT